jgi:hypothetical protein
MGQINLGPATFPLNSASGVTPPDERVSLPSASALPGEVVESIGWATGTGIQDFTWANDPRKGAIFAQLVIELITKRSKLNARR